MREATDERGDGHARLDLRHALARQRRLVDDRGAAQNDGVARHRHAAGVVAAAAPFNAPFKARNDASHLEVLAGVVDDGNDAAASGTEKTSPGKRSVLSRKRHEPDVWRRR